MKNQKPEIILSYDVVGAEYTPTVMLCLKMRDGVHRVICMEKGDVARQLYQALRISNYTIIEDTTAECIHSVHPDQCITCTPREAT